MWFEDAVFYQLEPAAFGGDLEGVSRRLQHVRSVGADAVWLLPFYVSPYRDGGYDVVDHVGVSDRFGTVDDLRRLLDRAHELGLRVVADLVVQHTSVDHPWFRAARADERSPYRDHYVWTDHPHETIVEPVFPTVEDSVWEFDDLAGAYYRHTFYAHEPDLNTGHPEVRAEIQRIMTFWLDAGLDGFRVDAVPYMVRQAALTDPRDDGFWLLEEMQRTATAVRPDAVLMGEVDVPLEDLPRYFGDGKRLHLLLDFWLNNHLFLAFARHSAQPIVEALEAQPDPPAGSGYAAWLRNHDELDLERLSESERDEVMAAFAPQPRMRAFGRGIRRRLGPMLGDDERRIALAHAVLYAQPCVPVLRYGDEVGLGEDLELPERAAVRLPMPWATVESQSLEPDSLLGRIAQLGAVRAEIGRLHEAGCQTLAVGNDAVLALLHRGDRPLVTLANLSPDAVEVTLPAEVPAELADLVADANGYPPYRLSSGRGIALNPYGYRWLR